MNFGTILNSVTKNCVTLMVECREDESKSLARDFIRYVQLKEVLNKQFLVYTQLNSSFIKDRESAKMFVTETLAVLGKFDFEDILSYNHLLETKFNVNKIPSSSIDMDISKAIKYTTSENKVDQAGFVASLNNIIEHISTIREQENKLSGLNEDAANSQLKFLQPKHVIRIALKKFNGKYTSNFDDEDRIVFNTLREGNKSDIENLYDRKVNNLLSIFESSRGQLSEDLSKKLSSAVEKISTGYTQSNLLDAHELASELERLNKQ